MWVNVINCWEGRKHLVFGFLDTAKINSILHKFPCIAVYFWSKCYFLFTFLTMTYGVLGYITILDPFAICVKFAVIFPFSVFHWFFCINVFSTENLLNCDSSSKRYYNLAYNRIFYLHNCNKWFSIDLTDLRHNSIWMMFSAPKRCSSLSNKLMFKIYPNSKEDLTTAVW